MRKFILSNLVLSSVVATISVLVTNQFFLAEETKTASLWVYISRILFNQKEPPVEPRNGGSRDIPLLCMVSPDAPQVYRTVWNDRPFFLWQGKVARIAVRLLHSNENLWIYPTAKIQSVTYKGEPLQPGKTYKWIVNGQQFVPFKIMEQEERDRIGAELKNIENQLESAGANPEVIALAKANYFADHNLWSDVLQQIYSVPEPSSELLALRQDILGKLCQY